MITITITNPDDLQVLSYFGGPHAVMLVPRSADPELPEPYTLLLQRPLMPGLPMVNEEGEVVQPSVTVRVLITRDVLLHLLKQLGRGPTELPRHPERQLAEGPEWEADESGIPHEGTYDSDRMGSDDWAQFEDPDDDTPTHFAC